MSATDTGNGNGGGSTEPPTPTPATAKAARAAASQQRRRELAALTDARVKLAMVRTDLQREQATTAAMRRELAALRIELAAATTSRDCWRRLATAGGPR